MKRMTAWFGGLMIVLSLVLMPSVQATEKSKEWVGSEASFQMNERVQTWLINTLEKMTTAAEKAADFAADELPLFVQEFVLYHIVYNWFIVGVSLLIIGACIWIDLYLWKICRKAGGYDWEVPAVVGTLGISLVFIPTVFIFCSYIGTALMVTFAPRVFLLTEFIKFFK